jgi:lipopolysaccharide transport system permease protein
MHGVLLVLVYLILATLLALGVALWGSALNVRFRDVSALLPFGLQLWMYATPVVYPLSVVPSSARAALLANPLTGIVECTRGALFGSAACPRVALLTLLLVAAVFISGLCAFAYFERDFADTI